MSTSWSEIPTDLLYSILSKFSIPDLFRCAAVCSSWSTVVDKVRRRQDDQPPQIQWLVPEHQILINGEKNDRNTYNFFSLSEGREYDIPSHAPRILKKIVGSSHGWLIILNDVRVQLLNPITGVQIDLPLIPTVYNQNLEAMKAALSADPSRCGNYKVVFVFFCHSKRKYFLLFISAGDEKWTTIPGDLYYYDDITFHDGKLYAVSQSYEEDNKVIVEAYDLTVSDLTLTRMPAMPYIWGFGFMYFFCTPSDDDLLIARAIMMEKVSEHHIEKLQVWKVDTKNGVLIPMNNFGKYALFMGSAASSLCLDTSSLPDLKSNSIYISNFLGDNVVYNMKDKSFTSLNLPLVSSPELHRRVLVWFTPSCAC